LAFGFRIAPLIVAIGALASSAISAQAPAGAKPGQPTMTVVCSTAATAVFKATISNPGDRAISLMLGFTPGSPQPQVFTGLTVAVIRIATGATEEYVYVNPKYATYSGKRDPWIVPLKAGGTYAIEVPLRDFISSMNYNALEPGTAVGGQLILDARAVPNQPGRVWTGKIETAIDSCG